MHYIAALLFLWFLLASFLFCCHRLDAELDYLTIAKANFPGKSFRRQRLPAAGALARFCFRHPLRRVKDVVIVFEVAQKGHSVVYVVFYYQVAPAVAAFYDVLVKTGLYQYRYDYCSRDKGLALEF